MVAIRDISHVHCGTKVTFSLLGGRPLKELPVIPVEGPMISRREQEIIYFISRGYTSRKIASELNISEYTVNTHRKNILRKTGTKNVVDMLIYSATNGGI
jgi:DNA-binding CsgD family transcriptional regulator